MKIIQSETVTRYLVEFSIEESIYLRSRSIFAPGKVEVSAWFTEEELDAIKLILRERLS